METETIGNEVETLSQLFVETLNYKVSAILSL